MNSIAKAGFGSCMAAAKLGYTQCNPHGRHRRNPIKIKSRKLSLKLTFTFDPLKTHDARLSFSFFPYTLFPLFSRIHTLFDAFDTHSMTVKTRLKPAKTHDFTISTAISPFKHHAFDTKLTKFKLRPLSSCHLARLTTKLDIIKDNRKKLALFHSILTILSLLDDIDKKSNEPNQSDADQDNQPE